MTRLLNIKCQCIVCIFLLAPLKGQKSQSVNKTQMNEIGFFTEKKHYTVELQWLEHPWDQEN